MNRGWGAISLVLAAGSALAQTCRPGILWRSCASDLTAWFWAELMERISPAQRSRR